MFIHYNINNTIAQGRPMSSRFIFLILTLAFITSLTEARVVNRACQPQTLAPETVQVRPIHRVYHKKLACLFEKALCVYAPIIEAYRKTKVVSAVEYPRALDELRERVVDVVGNHFGPCCRGSFFKAILSLLFLGPMIYFFIVLPIEQLCQYNARLSPIGQFCAYHIPRTLSQLGIALNRAVGSPLALEIEGFIDQLEDTARLLVATSL